MAKNSTNDAEHQMKKETKNATYFKSNKIGEYQIFCSVYISCNNSKMLQKALKFIFCTCKHDSFQSMIVCNNMKQGVRLPLQQNVHRSMSLPRFCRFLPKIKYHKRNISRFIYTSLLISNTMLLCKIRKTFRKKTILLVVSSNHTRS